MILSETVHQNFAVCKIHTTRVFTVRWYANERPLVIMRYRRRRLLSCHMNIRLCTINICAAGTVDGWCDSIIMREIIEGVMMMISFITIKSSL